MKLALILHRCITGNVAEFVLIPIFSSRDSIFACHVHPVKRYKIYDIDYWLTYQGQIVNDVRLSASRLADSQHPQRAVDAYVQVLQYSAYVRQIHHHVAFTCNCAAN